MTKIENKTINSLITPSDIKNAVKCIAIGAVIAMLYVIYEGRV